jgi:hypothetical protein
MRAIRFFTFRHMKCRMWIKLAASLALGLALVLLGITPFSSIEAAVAQVPPSGTFSADRTCEAPRAINGQNPGNVQVRNGQRYEAIGFNSSEKKFIQIKVPGATPERRWVNASCGTFSEVSDVPPAPSPDPSPIPPKALLPFFDTVDNPEQHGFPRDRKADITPPPPELSEFDKAVLKTCGPIGTKLKASNFKQLMLDNPAVLDELQQAVDGELLSGRSTEAEFLDDLTTVWTGREGFEHIFCGELDGPREIGGLHFFGRYLQLQNEGIGGRLADNLKKEEVVPGVIQTLGVIIKTGGKTWIDDLKGYAVVSDAQEMLLDATKAFKAQGNAQGACLLPVEDDDTGKSYKAVFVKGTAAGVARDAIVTFFPDATPGGKDCR